MLTALSFGPDCILFKCIKHLSEAPDDGPQELTTITGQGACKAEKLIAAIQLAQYGNLRMQMHHFLMTKLKHEPAVARLPSEEPRGR
jgi:DNA polymerase/3'-5' exonuclease PolX